MKRVVFTIAIGRPKFAHCALGLGRSLRLIGDTTHRVVLTDQVEFPWEKSFDTVLRPTATESVYLRKLDALELTDADQVLFLDADSLAFRRLDDIFERCQGTHFAVQGRRVREGYWYGDVSRTLERHGLAELPQFNGGLLYYERTDAARELIEACRRTAADWSALGFEWDRPGVPDEPVLALAMARTGIGTVLPDELDFTNTAMGLIGKLHLDVERGLCEYVCRRYETRFVRPYVFHAARYIHFLAYWRQLAKLERLETYEARHGYGYMSPGQKLRRSIERRILKARGKL